MKKSILSIVIIAVAMMTSVSAFAGEHPAYLHALADLRAARWLIDHHPAKDWKQSEDEAGAVRAIDAAINEIKHAAIDDHKDLNDHTGVQEIPERQSRLRKAAELLKRTREDINQHEENGFAQGLRDRAIRQIDEALRLTQRAIAVK
jgi:hypothetical protein